MLITLLSSLVRISEGGSASASSAKVCLMNQNMSHIACNTRRSYSCEIAALSASLDKPSKFTFAHVHVTQSQRVRLLWSLDP